MASRSDYAGNSGSVVNPNDSWPNPGRSAMCWARLSNQTRSWIQNLHSNNTVCGGVIFQHHNCRMSEITDGSSNTFLCGEKNIDPDYYLTGQDPGDDQGWTLGWDYNSCRYTYYPPTAGDPPPNPAPTRPAHLLRLGLWQRPHQRLRHGDVRRFGPSHQLLDHAEIYRRLGDRADGLTVDGKKW